MKEFPKASRTHARANMALQPDPSDHYTPRPMAEQRVLFRSMALGELLDIIRTGQVNGGGNAFHSGEHRPYVFFGDDLNERLLANGESLDRCVGLAIRDHAIHAQIALAGKVLRWWARAIVRQMRRDRLKHYRRRAWTFRSGGSARELIRSISISANVDRARYASLFRGYAAARRALSRAEAEHNALLRAELSRLARLSANQPFTSAVIVTMPISGGLEYRGEFGITLNGGEPEYGFRRGQLTLADLSEVLLVKSGEIIHRLDIDQGREIERLCEAAIAVEPADEASVTWVGFWGGRLTVTCRLAKELEWRIEGNPGLFPLRLPWIFA